LSLGRIDFDTVIVRFGGEVGIKGEWTRRSYERLLVKNIKKTLEYHSLNYDKIIYTRGRIYIKTGEAIEICKKLSKVFGISSLSPAVETSSNLDDIVEKTVSFAANVLSSKKTFAVRCRRVGVHPYSCMDVCRRVGQKILESFPKLGLKVDLEKPDISFQIEVRDDKAFVFSDVIHGAGGFPLGSQPKLVCLLSGGIDSPVACWLVMKRGAPIIPIYFDNSPFTDETTLERAVKTAKVLFEWAIGFPKELLVVPHGQNLLEIKEKCPEKLTCILCKRMMYRIAEKIAKKTGAEGIVTGESIGEQASQTLQNLRVLDEAVKEYPVYRPLIGLDKLEIEHMAKKIGTFEFSIEKAMSCRAVPRRPSTKAKLKVVLECEQSLDVDFIVNRSIENIRSISC